jgi:hypothetical protein
VEAQSSEQSDIFSLEGKTAYLVGIYQKASGIDSIGQTAVANINAVTPAAGNHMALARLGFQVKF